MSSDIFEMSDEEHVQWLREQGVFMPDLAQPSEENLCRMMSQAMRTTDPQERAQAFIDIANMSLALADMSMGSQHIVPQCLVLQQH